MEYRENTLCAVKLKEVLENLLVGQLRNLVPSRRWLADLEDLRDKEAAARSLKHCSPMLTIGFWRI